MLSHPAGVVVFLLALEAFVLWLAGTRRFARIFDVLPAVFFIYFLPMVASTAGLIDPKAPVLGWITTHVLPPALFLLLVTVDLPAICRLGGQALGMFFIGSAGIIVGMVIAFVLCRNVVGPDFWAGFGALSASWTGGSANMIAVKEALAVPDSVYLPMVVVDTVVPYLWMGILVAAVRWQEVFDRWNGSDRTVLEALRVRASSSKVERDPVTLKGLLILLTLAALVSGAAQHLAGHLPQIKDMISPYAWTIIVVTTVSLGLSLTPARKLANEGATRIGYWLLYFVLTAIGAKASLVNLGTSVVLIGAGVLVVAVHLVFLLAGARLLRAPLFLVATASQANIGGVASAPAVAAIYEPGLASVGLLLAILGNIVGTYLGILCAQFCRCWV